MRAAGTNNEPSRPSRGHAQNQSQGHAGYAEDRDGSEFTEDILPDCRSTKGTLIQGRTDSDCGSVTRRDRVLGEGIPEVAAPRKRLAERNKDVVGSPASGGDGQDDPSGQTENASGPRDSEDRKGGRWSSDRGRPTVFELGVHADKEILAGKNNALAEAVGDRMSRRGGNPAELQSQRQGRPPARIGSKGGPDERPSRCRRVSGSAPTANVLTRPVVAGRDAGHRAGTRYVEDFHGEMTFSTAAEGPQGLLAAFLFGTRPPGNLPGGTGR